MAGTYRRTGLVLGGGSPSAQRLVLQASPGQHEAHTYIPYVVEEKLARQKHSDNLYEDGND